MSIDSPQHGGRIRPSPVVINTPKSSLLLQAPAITFDAIEALPSGTAAVNITGVPAAITVARDVPWAQDTSVGGAVQP